MKKVLLIILCLFVLERKLFPQTFEEYANKAQNALNQENYNEAIKYISKLLEYKSNFRSLYKVSDLYINRSYCRRKLGNYKDAENDINEALKLTPEYLKLFDVKNQIYYETKEYQKIIDNSQKVLEFDPRNTDFLTWIGHAYLLKRDYAKSISYLDTVLSINTNDIEVLRLKGSVYSSQKKYEEALAINNLILSQKANDPGTYINRAINYARLNKFDEAMADNDFAASLDSSMKPVTLNNKAFFIKLEQKDYKGAITLLDECVRLDPGFAFGYSNRGFAKLKLGDVSGALKDVQKSVDLDPTNSYAWKNYALIRLEQKKTGEACSLLKKAKDLGYTTEYDNEVEDLLNANCIKK